MAIRKEDVRFEENPGDQDTNFGWSIVRAPAEGVLKLVGVSRRYIGVRTHYYKGRTTPCLKSNCEPCKRQMLSRWHGYLLTVNADTESNCILEFTPPCALILKKHLDEGFNLRGQQVIVARTSKRVNGKVTLTLKGMSPKAHRLIPEIDTWTVLSHIWGLNREAPAEFDEFTPEGLAEAERIRLAAEQLGETDENAWMHKRASDLAGQQVLPLDVAANLAEVIDGRPSSNGHY